ncbi:hypothetical protein SEA_RUCHI_51 [Arthrobacter phage Ruchi]|nr:hypothetical protein SEA_BASILISK_52 [Arthrobacter phage Basilisk]WNM69499.1 hypothetical protein SEA_RUCHI_51 [Arthrobacter phage Ruchi]
MSNFDVRPEAVKGRKLAAAESAGKRKRYGLAAGFLVVALAGFGLGSSGKGEAAPAPAPAPVVKTETKTVTVEKVPAACLSALDHAETGFSHAAEGFGAAGEALNAAANFDVAGMEAQSSKLLGVNDKLGALAPRWQDARDKCRAAAK